MNANALVLNVVAQLKRLNIPYMLVGSYSSNAFGTTRSTQDADFVIETSQRSINELMQSLQPGIIFDPQMRLESVTATLRYVGSHQDSGFKIELFLLSNDPFDRERFARRREQPFLHSSATLPTPEDVVIQKLRWFHLAKRAKDFDDVRNVLGVQIQSLDLAYMRHWCDQHGTRDVLDQLIAEAQKIDAEG